MRGYLAPDGRKGIRNVVAVAYLVECAHHVAREIAADSASRTVHVIGFPGCYPNAYAAPDDASGSARTRMSARCCWSRSAARVSTSAACAARLPRIRPAGADRRHPGDRRHAQHDPAQGAEWVRAALAQLGDAPRADDGADLVVGTICGGSDGTTGMTGNPAPGRAFDTAGRGRARRCIFEETGELIGCEHIMAARAATPELAREIVACIAKAARYYAHARLRHLRRRQRRGRADHDRGEVARRLCKVGAVADRRPDQARRRAAARRPLSARRGPGRRSAVRLPQHQRQRRDRRTDRLRQPRDPVCHRARLGGRLGDLAGDQDLRQSRDLSPDDATTWTSTPAASWKGAATLEEVGARDFRLVIGGGRWRDAPSPRSSATRNSS